ncbi:MAG: energy-coupling factor transporter ATPase [Coriobacteriia bacterium]|nr:energy-coupling factor transporter ATPase [Coriobacteriia bacterium]
MEFQSVSHFYNCPEGLWAPGDPVPGEVVLGDPAAGEVVPGGPAPGGQLPGECSLDRLSLCIQPGELVGIIGVNGSGKSTLARCINALLHPQSGRVLTVGLDTSDPELLFEIRSHAGMVFQNPNTQIIADTVADDIAYGLENLAVPRPQMCERVEAALAQVGMQGHGEDNPRSLSGGQKQRIALAGILAMQPDILILDEPGAMLDVRGRRGIRRLSRELNEAGLTVIVITHFMEEAVSAHRVIVLDSGRIVADGGPKEVFSQVALLKRLGLDVPFSMQLAGALRERGFDLPETISPDDLEELLCSWPAQA